MKKSITFQTVLTLILIGTFGYSQSPASLSTRPTLSDIRNRFYKDYEELKDNNPALANEKIEEEDGDGMLTKFKRWEWLMQTRLMPDGTLPEPGIASRERANYLFSHPEANTLRSAAWTQIGTSTLPNNGGGAGRVNVIRFDPSNTNTIYAGTAGGGVWKSANGGTTWTAITDNISDLSIADIAIDPSNSNSIYIATGDGYGYKLGISGDFWGGLYSAGVLHSTDGGATWSATGLSYNQSDNIIIQRLVIDPSNSNNLLAATKNGISRSADGGATWTQPLAGHYYDVEFNTVNASIVYCSGNSNLYKSTDGGVTWSIMKSNAGSDRISIEVSDANSQVIYSLAISGSVFKSTDGGVTWLAKTFPTGANFFGYYDGVLTCSDVNSDYLIAGGSAMVKSIDGGTTWSSIGSGTHSDNHALIFLPGSTSTFYSGNDGGIYKTTNSGSGWTNLSAGLAIAQIYRLASSASDPNIIYSGWQDNGSNRWDGNTNTWTKVYGSDGMDCMVDYNNNQNVYVSYQYGALEKSTNGGSTFSAISACSANWITPIEMDPITPSTIYQGGSCIYKSTNSGTSWTNIGNALFSTSSNNSCEDIAIAHSDVNIIYACSFTVMVKTSNAGTTWTTITGSLPVTNTGLNQIAISNIDPNKAWVCLGGYSSGNKVFKTSDGGTTWTNISGTLPNVPVSTIVYENNSSDRLYIGTDAGVYYIDNSSSDWVYYNTGLPGVMVHELEINYSSNKIIAATFGRGLWQSDLMGSVVNTLNTNTVNQAAICPNGALNVSYTANGSFNSGNIFTAQLSDANGSFTSPASIGTLESITSGNISCTIPSNASGVGFRVRVIASIPSITGSDNGSNLTLNCSGPTNFGASNITSNSATVSWAGTPCATTYEVDYRKNGTWTKKTGLTTASCNITGLAASTTYSWKVKTVCVNSVSVSAFSTTHKFKTLSVKLDDNYLTDNVGIYPNPSKGNFEIKVSNDADEISVYNLLGQTIWSQSSIAANSVVEMRLNQPAGIYFVEVRVGQRVITKQVIIE